MTSDPASTLVRRIANPTHTQQLDLEWLVTNGLGGYASGTIGGAATRRYHGLLVSAHPAPIGRRMMWNHLLEQFHFAGGASATLGHVRTRNAPSNAETAWLREFRLEAGLPVWTYVAHGHVIEKRLFMPHRHNTVHLIYELIDGPGSVRLELRPSIHFRDHNEAVNVPMGDSYTLTARESRYELKGGNENNPVLRFLVQGHASVLTLDGYHIPDILYGVEEHRGYEASGILFTPGYFRVELQRERKVTLTASAESWPLVTALAPEAALAAEKERRNRLIAASHPSVQSGFGAELVLAADQFLIKPVGRMLDTARATAQGDEASTIIAGYHWFTDWGRDTMISLEGLTLVTGRSAEGGAILRMFAAHVRDGLIPNYFPDAENEGVYHTADASLWFFQALSRYMAFTDDRATLRSLLPVLHEIVAKHRGGTRFGIGCDSRDGLLSQGAEGYQLTWMDAKVGDWVVTPRRGKTVEINALWYNALRLLAEWLTRENEPGADEMEGAAEEVRISFNRRFWNAETDMLFDVVDGEMGNDPAGRPNQILAVSLTHPVLDTTRWKAVVDAVNRDLVTPVGLRSLAPVHPDYKSKYDGDLRARDAAYHQGTVWAWLIGPFIDAWRKVYPERREDALKLLSGFSAHLSEACIGSISEVFDAESPYTPRACIAQAWSVAEVLRSLRNLANDEVDRQDFASAERTRSAKTPSRDASSS